MKMIVVVALALVAVAAAAPTAEPVKTLRSEFNQEPEGGFKSSFETENGIRQDQVGELKDSVDENNKPIKVLTLRGFYSYINPDGKEETVNYEADENGFRADGPSIPKGPEAVARR